MPQGGGLLVIVILGAAMVMLAPQVQAQGEIFIYKVPFIINLIRVYSVVVSGAGRVRFHA